MTTDALPPKPEDAPSPPVTARLRKKVNPVIGWGALILALLIVGTAWHYTFGRSEDSKFLIPGVGHTVTYSVSGTAGSAKISYADSTGKEVEVNNATLPWTETFDANTGLFLDLNATSLSPTGRLTTEIQVDSASRKRATTDSAYGTTEVSDTL